MSDTEIHSQSQQHGVVAVFESQVPDEESIALQSLEQSQQVLRDRNNNSFQSSLGSQTSANSPSQFRKLSLLNKAFVKRGRETDCVNCGQHLKTVEAERIMKHVRKCRKIDSPLREDLIAKWENIQDSRKKDSNRLLNERWARFMVTENVAFSCVERRSFREFAEACNKDWRYPSRHIYSNDYIPRMSREIKQSFSEIISKSVSFISIEFDHWSDLTCRSLLGVIFTLPNGDRYVQDLINVSTEGHSALTTVKHLQSTLSSIPHTTINSIVSDSASACKLARELLVEKSQYKHVIQHRCMAHLLNRMGVIFGEDENIRDAFAWASRIVNFISHSQKLLGFLEESHQRRPKKACKVRWYSTVNMIESLLDAKMLILDEVVADNELTKVNCDWMNAEHNWADLERSLKVLRPLADCIGIAERKSGTLSEAIGSLLRYARMLFMRDWGEPLTVAGIISFLTYFGPDKLGHEEFSLMLAAYVLDRRNKCDYITEEGLDLALDAILRVAHKSRCPLDSINRVLVEEYSRYCAQEGEFSKYQQTEQSAESWWNDISACSSLRQVAMRIVRLRSSSANIERTFSDLKWFQGTRRTNLSVDTLTHLARVKIYEETNAESQVAQDIEDESESQQNESDEHFESFTTNATQDDAISLDQLDPDYQHATADHYLPELLDPEIRALFDKFISYVDFTIDNELVLDPSQSQQELSSERIAELKEESRRLRSRMRKGAVSNTEENTCQGSA